MPNHFSGAGTVFQNRQGQWIAMIELPRGPDGKRRRRLRRARTKAEAKAKLVALQDELHQTGTVADANRTVAEAVEAFRAGRPTSVHDDWLLGLVVSGVGGKKVKRPPATSPRLDLITQNVAEVAKLPTTDVPPRDRRSLTIDELHRLLKVSDGAIGVLVDLCGRNGLRPAEARALRWEDLDLDEGLLHVTGQMDRTNTRGPVKRAANAARTIGIDQATIGRLTTWRSDRDALQATARSAWTEHGFVAVGGIGHPIGREAFAIAMRRLCADAAIDPHVTPYELRHTAISLQADAGRTSWEIADWAGTSEAMISSRYRHRLRRVSTLLPADVAPT